MTLLEDYLDNYEKEQKSISKSIYSMYKRFNYEDEDKYILDLDFMLKNIYNIKFLETNELRKKRMEQTEFRQKLLEEFDNKCIVTGDECEDELEACHIVPVSTNKDYSIDNGLVLARNIHATFDKFTWSINPDTFTIECINIEDKKIGTIKKYIGNVLPLNDDMRENIRDHYEKYIIKNTL